MGFFADNSEIFSKLEAVTELSLGIALVIGFAAGFVGLAVTGFLLALWLSELGLFWIWELPGLIVVALAVGIGNLPHLLRGTRRERLLGPPSSTTWPLWKRLAIAPTGALALAARARPHRPTTRHEHQQEHGHKRLALGRAWASAAARIRLSSKRMSPRQGPACRGGGGSSAELVRR